MKGNLSRQIILVALALLLSGLVSPARPLAAEFAADAMTETPPAQQFLRLDGGEGDGEVLVVPVWGYPLGDEVTFDLALRPHGGLAERTLLPDGLDLKELAGNVMIGISCRF